jgi:hypothetical protein
MLAADRRFRSFQVKPQPCDVREGTGPTINHSSLDRGRYLSTRAERGRRRAEKNGQTPEDMISGLLDKAAGGQ